MEDAENGWKTHGERVVNDLKELKDCYKDVVEKVITNKIDIAVLQVKAARWGAITGAITAVIVTVIGGLILYLVTRK